MALDTLRDRDVVMLVPIIDLMLALDDSVDMYGCTEYSDEGDSCCDGWICLQRHKLRDCGPTFIDSIVNNGVQAPIVVQVVESYSGRPDRWIQGNGNHRLSAMLKYDPYGDIPVLFSTGDYMRTDISEGSEPSSYS